MEPFIEVNLVGLIMDQVSKSPVMMLKARDEKKVIPIWIGMNEANAIAMELENICSPRPMTHDLLRNIMRDLEAILAKVIITDIVENTYYAELHIEKNGQERVIDCRPSDAVALALKNHARSTFPARCWRRRCWPTCSATASPARSASTAGSSRCRTTISAASSSKHRNS